MDFLNFLREEPVMGWFALIVFLVTVVPLASVLWHRIFRRNQVEVVKQPAQETKSTHFGNQSELIILLIGVVLLIAVIIWIRSAFFG